MERDPYSELVAATQDTWAFEPLAPYWSIEYPEGKDKKEEKLKWFKEFFDSTETHSMLMLERQLINRFKSRGVYWEGQDPYGYFTNNVNRVVDDSTRINVPDEHRYVQNFSTRLLRYKSETLPTPATNELKDKQLTRVARMSLTSIKQQFDFDRLDRSMARRLPTDGESFLLVLWDKDAGELSPRYRKAKKKYGDKKVKFKKEDWIYDPTKPEFIGDFKFVVAKAGSLRFDPDATCPEDCQCIAWINFRHIKKIMSDYPDMKEQIREKATSDISYNLKDINPATGLERNDPDYLPEIHFWHRKHKELPYGAHVVFIPGLILKDEENEFCELSSLDDCPWGELPIESMVDIPIEDALHGYPSLNIFSSFTRARNQILSSNHMNLLLHDSPKLAVHSNSEVDIESILGGGITFTWSGEEKPELLTFNTISKDSIAFYELLGEEWSKAANMHPITQGDPPAGITAGVALRLLQEIEDKLFEEQIKMLNRYVVSRDMRILAMQSKYYKKEDERFLHIVGEDNTDLIEELDTRMLGVKWNVKLDQVNPGAFSAAAKKQDVIDLLQYGAEGTLSPEQVIDAMELNRPDKITDPAQTAVANAEYVVELVSSGKDFPMPREGENYMVKWKIFMAYYNKQSFSELSAERQKKFVNMVIALEFLMDEQALKNPVYNQMLLTQPQWPAFYTPSARPIPLEQQVADTANQAAMNQITMKEASFGQGQEAEQPLQ